MKNSDIIKLLRNELKTIAPEAKRILYGSRARGDYRVDSDVDVLILLPDYYEGQEYVKRQSEISEQLYYLSLDNDIDISPLITVEKVYYERKTPFTINIANEGIPL